MIILFYLLYLDCNHCKRDWFNIFYRPISRSKLSTGVRQTIVLHTCINCLKFLPLCSKHVSSRLKNSVEVVNICCGLDGGKLIEPFFYDGTLNGRRFINFYQRLLDDVSFDKRERMFFQPYEAQLLLENILIEYFLTAGLVLMALFLGLHDPQI